MNRTRLGIARVQRARVTVRRHWRLAVFWSDYVFMQTCPDRIRATVDRVEIQVSTKGEGILGTDCPCTDVGLTETAVAIVVIGSPVMAGITQVAVGIFLKSAKPIEARTGHADRAPLLDAIRILGARPNRIKGQRAALRIRCPAAHSVLIIQALRLTSKLFARVIGDAVSRLFAQTFPIDQQMLALVRELIAPIQRIGIVIITIGHLSAAESELTLPWRTNGLSTIRLGHTRHTIILG